jgi:hypothetical protein
VEPDQFAEYAVRTAQTVITQENGA